MNSEVLAASATQFLREHLAEPITVADLADHLSWSPSHLTRAFTRTVGASPIRYLAALRFQEAKRLLAVERLGVLEACHEVGFSSVGTFTRRFVADVGLPPGEFRRAVDRMSEVELAPVSLWAPGIETRVRVRLEVPPGIEAGLGPLPYQWIGTFPTPVPSGPPLSGTLRRGVAEVELPIPGPGVWLLANLTPSSAGIADHLWSACPFVARHPVPLTGQEGELVLRVDAAKSWDHPVLVALPAMHPRV
ncbi:MAG: AraC family transcriptional regulator [Propionibacteriaceae bacterium]|nr:AraC family transcriptional regulator [Propionibacteriaceae bacterium]